MFWGVWIGMCMLIFRRGGRGIMGEDGISGQDIIYFLDVSQFFAIFLSLLLLVLFLISFSFGL